MMIAPSLRWTSADLEALPDDGKRYEIIDGELHVAKQPAWHHQETCGAIYAVLHAWSLRTGAGRASIAPGVIFDAENDVAPDVVWVSSARLAAALDEAGHLHTTPELVVEVLSPGAHNERRDRKAKLKLYAQRDVDEYWIVDWRIRMIEVYRRTAEGLVLATTISGPDGVLTTPLLQGFEAPLAVIFAGFPPAE